MKAITEPSALAAGWPALWLASAPPGRRLTSVLAPEARSRATICRLPPQPPLPGTSASSSLAKITDAPVSAENPVLRRSRRLAAGEAVAAGDERRRAGRDVAQVEVEVAHEGVVAAQVSREGEEQHAVAVGRREREAGVTVAERSGRSVGAVDDDRAAVVDATAEDVVDPGGVPRLVASLLNAT